MQIAHSKWAAYNLNVCFLLPVDESDGLAGSVNVDCVSGELSPKRLFVPKGITFVPFFKILALTAKSVRIFETVPVGFHMVTS